MITISFIVIKNIIQKMDDWLNLLINSSVAAGTLYLGYMAYKQIKENRLIENVKMHSNDLKSFLRQWQEKYLLKIAHAESEYKCYNFVLDEPPRFDEPIPLILVFTKRENLLYEDLKNHLPSEYNILHERWSEYKELIREYDEKRKNLSENIKNDLDRTERTTFPAFSIYARAVSLGLKDILGRASIYDYSVEKERSAISWKLRYGTYEIYWILGEVPISETIVSDKKESENKEHEIAKLKAEHETVADNYYIKYKEEIKEILTIEGNLRKRREEISTLLENIILIPNLPNECKYIKNAIK